MLFILCYVYLDAKLRTGTFCGLTNLSGFVGEYFTPYIKRP